MSKYFFLYDGDPDYDDLAHMESLAASEVMAEREKFENRKKRFLLTRLKPSEVFGAHTKEKTMKLDMECKLLAGAESKAFLADFTKQIDRLEKLTRLKVNGSKAQAVEDEEEESEEETEVETASSDDDEEDFGKSKKTSKKKAAASFDEDEEPEADAEEDSEQEEEEAPKKSAKAKKLTINDVNDACRARAASTGGKKGRAEVLAILKKKFKTESVSELKPEQYAACVSAMEV